MTIYFWLWQFVSNISVSNEVTNVRTFLSAFPVFLWQLNFLLILHVQVPWLQLLSFSGVKVIIDYYIFRVNMYFKGCISIVKHTKSYQILTPEIDLTSSCWEKKIMRTFCRGKQQSSPFPLQLLLLPKAFGRQSMAHWMRLKDDGVEHIFLNSLWDLYCGWCRWQLCSNNFLAAALQSSLWAVWPKLEQQREDSAFRGHAVAGREGGSAVCSAVHRQTGSTRQQHLVCWVQVGLHRTITSHMSLLMALHLNFCWVWTHRKVFSILAQKFRF